MESCHDPDNGWQEAAVAPQFQIVLILQGFSEEIFTMKLSVTFQIQISISFVPFVKLKIFLEKPALSRLFSACRKFAHLARAQEFAGDMF
jgi:hypothetical protein